MYKDRTFIGLIVSVFLMMSGLGMIMPSLPQKVINFDGSGDSIGFLASSFAVSYILFQIPIGQLADRFGFKPLLAGGYYLCASVGVLYSFSHSSTLIFAGRFLQGVGEVPVWALASALLSIRYPYMTGKAIGIYNAVFHLGLTAGPLLGIVFHNLFPGIDIFLVYAGLCLAGGLVVQAGTEQVMPGAGTETRRVDFRNLVAVLSRRMTLLVLMGIALYGSGYGLLMTVVPGYLINTKGFGSVEVGIFFSLFYVCITASQLVTGHLSDRFGRMKFMICGLVAAAVSLMAFQAFDRYWDLMILGVASLGFGTFFLSSQAYLNEMASGALKGTVSGTYFLFWGAGYFLGPMVTGMVEKHMAPGRGIAAFAVLILCEAALLIIVSASGHLKTIRLFFSNV